MILIDNSAVAAPKTKEIQKWTDDPAEARNWLVDRLSEIHSGKYIAGIFDPRAVEAMMPSTTPSRTERLAFWRDEYALDSFTILQRLLAFMLSQS